MRRLIAITLLLIAVPLVLVFGLGANDGGGSGYKVRAIFDFVRAVPGEDVKVAGAKVGTIDSLHVTPDNKAAVVLKINNSGFTPFHKNAHCTIRPQSLIGETFAECSPGSSAAPVLPTIKQGDGKGQHLLPVSNTSSPVDIDEINDIMREPTRERLALIINEIGTALAGRGKDLNAAIHRANPALRDTDKVLAILAAQNRTLANLAKNSDAVLTPLAALRLQVADFIVQAHRTAQATAQVRGAISAGIQRFPAFLRQLKPTLKSLGATGAVNRLMDYIFFQMTAINGFDSVSHYLRAGLILNACSTYATKVVAPDCRATFDKNASSSTASSASSSPTGDPVLDATHAAILKALKGEKV